MSKGANSACEGGAYLLGNALYKTESRLQTGYYQFAYNLVDEPTSYLTDLVLRTMPPDPGLFLDCDS